MRHGRRRRRRREMTARWRRVHRSRRAVGGRRSAIAAPPRADHRHRHVRAMPGATSAFPRRSARGQDAVLRRMHRQPAGNADEDHSRGVRAHRLPIAWPRDGATRPPGGTRQSPCPVRTERPSVRVRAPGGIGRQAPGTPAAAATTARQCHGPAGRQHVEKNLSCMAYATNRTQTSRFIFLFPAMNGVLRPCPGPEWRRPAGQFPRSHTAVSWMTAPPAGSPRSADSRRLMPIPSFQ